MRLGLDIGPRVGLGDASAGLDVVLDETAGIYVPADATEWDTVLAAAGISSGGPSHLWLLQEAASPWSDTIGGVSMAQGGSGVAGNQTATGWTRKGVKASVADSYIIGDVGGNYNTTSGLLLQCFTLADPAANKFIAGLGTTIAEGAGLAPGPLLRAVSNASAANGAVAHSGITAIVTRYNRTAGSLTVMSPLETVAAPVFQAQGVADDLCFMLGDGGAAATLSVMVYAALFEGAAAELSDASVRSLLETLGWEVTW